MIQKYHNSDTMILIPTNVPFVDKDLYTYEWYLDHNLIGCAYQVSCTFPRSKKYKITLIVSASGYKTTTNRYVNVVL